MQGKSTARPLKLHGRFPLRRCQICRRLMGKDGLDIRASHEGEIDGAAIGYRQNPLALFLVERSFECNRSGKAVG